MCIHVIVSSFVSLIYSFFVGERLALQTYHFGGSGKAGGNAYQSFQCAAGQTQREDRQYIRGLSFARRVPEDGDIDRIGACTLYTLAVCGIYFFP